MATIEKIKQYTRRLEKHQDDKAVLKDTLHKLEKIDVTVDILQETGVGKIVNVLKKRTDSAGVMASDLIRKWRKIVDREAETEVDNGFSMEESPAKTSQHHRSSTVSTKSSSGRHSKPEPPSEPELFSDAVLTVKKEIIEEPRHSKNGSSSSSSKPSNSSNQNSNSASKERSRKESHGAGQSRDDETSRRSHKDDAKGHNHSSKDADRSHHKSSSQQKSVESTKHRDKSSSSGSSQKSDRRQKDDSKPSSSSKSAPEPAVSVKQEPTTSKDKDRTSRKRKAEEGAAGDTEEADGMNALNFGSFEDCLGSIDPKKQKKKKRPNTGSRSGGSTTSTVASPKMTVTSSTLNGSVSKPKGPRLPDLLDSKKSSDSQLSHHLPMPQQLVTDYKPLPRVEPRTSASSSSTSAATTAAAHRTMTNEEAVMFTSSRKDRTAVYSGRKQHTLSTVPTLYEACVRVLVDHVDLIDETGGVPFEIMKPIMERCTWQQLYRLEYYNPNLTEDSDPLWEVHVRRDFRGKTPAKGEETWRELYLRCHDEREQKLKDLKESIGQSMKAKQAPVRMTKLAYVDSMAKPPRNVQRAQLKHGTHLANRAKPSQARSIAAQASTSAATEPVRAPTSAAAKKPKPAPLMAKTLMFLKMRKTTGYGFSSR